MNFETSLASWLAGAQDIINKHFATNYPRLQVPTLKLERGKRYVKVVRCLDDQEGRPIERSAHAFVDTTNGDVLKPASWKAPAKHARGNIYDQHNGLGSMGVYGPAYL